MLASIASMSQAVTDDEINAFVAVQNAITNLYDRDATCTVTPCASDCNSIAADDLNDINEGGYVFSKTDYPNNHNIAFVHLPKSG